MLVPAIQQHKSAIIIHTCPPSIAALPSRIPPLQVITGARLGSPSNFSATIHLTPDSVCILRLVSTFIPLSPCSLLNTFQKFLVWWSQSSIVFQIPQWHFTLSSNECPSTPSSAYNSAKRRGTVLNFMHNFSLLKRVFIFQEEYWVLCYSLFKMSVYEKQSW